MPAKWVHRYELKPGRWVFNPSPESRAEGAGVKALVEGHWKAPAYYYHLRSGGHVAALRRHTKHLYFLKADIANFFGSISRSRLSRTLKEYVGHAQALSMATASTVRNPKDATKTFLPYGFVQSPVLASLVLHKSGLGSFLDAIHKDRKLAVTVYVDDIIISGNDLNRLEALREQLKLRMTKSGFTLALNKSLAPATAIAAFNIELAAGEALAIVEKRFLELKELVASSDSESQRAGLLGYVRSVNQDQADSIGLA